MTLTKEQIEQLCERLYHFAAANCTVEDAKDGWRRQINALRDAALRSLQEDKESGADGIGIILHNGLTDPFYSPYCGRCPGLKRMKKVEHLYWRCNCGAEHDERNYAPPSVTSERKDEQTLRVRSQAAPITQAAHGQLPEEPAFVKALRTTQGPGWSAEIINYIDALRAAIAGDKKMSKEDC